MVPLLAPGGRPCVSNTGPSVHYTRGSDTGLSTLIYALHERPGQERKYLLTQFAVLSLVLCFEFQKLLFLFTKRKYSLVSLLNNKHLFKTINIFSFIKRNTTCSFLCNTLCHEAITVQLTRWVPLNFTDRRDITWFQIVVTNDLYIFIDLPVHSLTKLTCEIPIGIQKRCYTLKKWWLAL